MAACWIFCRTDQPYYTVCLYGHFDVSRKVCSALLLAVVVGGVSITCLSSVTCWPRLSTAHYSCHSALGKRASTPENTLGCFEAGPFTLASFGVGVRIASPVSVYDVVVVGGCSDDGLRHRDIDLHHPGLSTLF